MGSPARKPHFFCQRLRCVFDEFPLLSFCKKKEKEEFLAFEKSVACRKGGGRKTKEHMNKQKNGEFF